MLGIHVLDPCLPAGRLALSSGLPSIARRATEGRVGFYFVTSFCVESLKQGGEDGPELFASHHTSEEAGELTSSGDDCPVPATDPHQTPGHIAVGQRCTCHGAEGHEGEEDDRGRKHPVSGVPATLLLSQLPVLIHRFNKAVQTHHCVVDHQLDGSHDGILASTLVVSHEHQDVRVGLPALDHLQDDGDLVVEGEPLGEHRPDPVDRVGDGQQHQARKDSKCQGLRHLGKHLEQCYFKRVHG